MKHMRRILSLILAIALIITVLPLDVMRIQAVTPAEESNSAAGASAKAATVAYPVSGGNIYFDPQTGMVTDCDESVTAANIPSMIGGVKVVGIGDSAFEYCANMSSVSFPDGITTIGDRAFSDCYRLSNLVIPDSVTEIGDFAFSFCSSLENVMIPNGVKQLSGSMFAGSGVMGIWVDETNPNYCNDPNDIYRGVLYNKDMTELIAYPSSWGDTFDIPKSVVKIGDHAFYACGNLESIVIPDNVQTIDDYAFLNCYGITSIIIGNGVKNIGVSAFESCFALEYVEIGKNVETIGDFAFGYCESLKNIEIPNSVKTIGEIGFFNCTGLTSISIPESVTKIGNEAFECCDHLENVYYAGSQVQWVKIDKGNNDFTGITIHFNEAKPGHICPSEGFADVPVYGNWAHAGIDYCVENELMNGTGGNRFNPNGTVSRAQLVTILYRMEGSPAIRYKNTFSDVPNGLWYTDAIEWAAANGVVNGIGGGKFGPDQSITREQIATILYRYEGEPAVQGNLNSFPDKGNVSSFAVNGLIWATQEGLITGVSSNGITTLAPKNNATRAQIASIIMRYCESSIDPSVGKEYTVTFKYNDGTQDTYNVLQVKHGTTVTQPTAPSRSGYAFNGWYTAPNGGEKFDFTSVITGNIGLYAKWRKNYEPSEEADVFFSDSLYTDISDAAHIQQHDAIRYYDNEIVIFVMKGTTQEQVEKMIAADSGYIVGKDGYANSYLIRFDQPKEYNEIEEILARYKNNSFVDETYFNVAMELDLETVPSYFSEEWPASSWDSSNPSGGNWGLEAINAPESWDFYDQMKSVNVGVFDGGCDIAHNDLKPVIVASSLGEKKSSSSIDHGTHVVGTIGAKFGDNFGVCGVCPTAKISVIDRKAADSQTIAGYFYCTAFSWLIATQKCKVVNMSMGYIDVCCKAATEGNDAAREKIRSDSEQIKKTLCNLRDSNNDFTIIVAAGNSNNSVFYESTQSPMGYYEKCTDSAHNHNGEYYVDFADIDSEGNAKCKRCTQDMLAHKSIGGVEAKWCSSLTFIEDSDLMSRIVVVGACKQDNVGGYAYSNFSTLGLRIDVVAPGENIESCISSGHGVKNGTSMAAPHVSGVAAMLYAVNSSLTGEQVKKIIKDTATIAVDGCSYKMIDAEAAVEEALRQRQIYGKVADNNGNPISGVSITLEYLAGSVAKTSSAIVSAADGSFAVSIPIDATAFTSLTFKKDGYLDISALLTVGLNSSSNVGIVRLEKETKTDIAKAYYDVLIRCTDELKQGNEDPNAVDNRGKLMDINNDGIEEMIIRYGKDYRLIGEIWTMEGDKARCIFKETMGYFAGTGPDGSLTVGSSNGDEYLVLYNHYGETFELNDEWTLFQLTDQGYRKMHFLRIHYIHSDSAGNYTQTPTSVEYFVDDIKTSEEAFLRWKVQAQTRLLVWDGYNVTDNSLSFSDLKSYLSGDKLSERSAYNAILSQLYDDRTFGMDAYAFYDMDQDGNDELIVHHYDGGSGYSEVQRKYEFYTIKSGSVEHVGGTSAYHASLLVPNDGSIGLYMYSTNAWALYLNHIRIQNNELIDELIYTESGDMGFIDYTPPGTKISWLTSSP